MLFPTHLCLCVGNIPTILLILYPTRLFRKCVSCCGFQRLHALHMFVESFQEQYKDGTNGTHDFRMVSASFLILRILMLFLFLNHNCLPTHTSKLLGVLFTGASCMHAITRPYNFNFMNNVDIVILFLQFYISIVNILYSGNNTAVTRCTHDTDIFFSKQNRHHSIYLKRLYKILKRCMQATRPSREAEADVETESDTGSLPD